MIRRALALSTVFVLATAAPAFAHEEINPRTVTVGQPTFLTLTAANEKTQPLTKVVLTAEMPANHLFSDGKKALVWAFGTLNSRFIADSLGPLIGTSGRIAGPTCLAAFEAARVNILSSSKQRTEQGDFGLGG